MFKIELGSEVKSKLTGFKGIAIANSIHLNGCNRIYVQPVVDKEGKMPDGSWIDEPEIEVIKKPKIKKDVSIKTGGFPSKIK